MILITALQRRLRIKAVAKLCEWPSSRCVSDSSRYIRSRAQYAARRLVLVKDDLPKGTGGLTGHQHASPSHDGAARTARTDQFQGVAVSRSVYDATHVCTSGAHARDTRCPRPPKRGTVDARRTPSRDKLKALYRLLKSSHVLRRAEGTHLIVRRGAPGPAEAPDKAARDSCACRHLSSGP